METAHFWLYALAEGLILATVAAIYLYVVNRRLKSRLGGRLDEPEEGGLSRDDYLDLLQTEVLQAEAKLAQLGSDGNPALRRLVEVRLSFLRTERRAIDHCSSDEDDFWQQVAEGLAHFVREETGTGDAEEAGSRSALMESLQTQIDAYRTRISNLEQFKDRFFELKARLADAHTVNQQLCEEVEKAIPTEAQSPELMESIQRLQSENADLATQLAQVEEEFAALMRNAQPSARKADKRSLVITEAGGNIGQSLERVKEIIVSKEEQISALQGLVNELQLELQEKERLQRMLDEFDQQNQELNNVVTILQDENNFLQEQISMLLKQELEKEEQRTRRIQDLQQDLDEQVRNFAELEKRYAAMEQEYLAMYEENQQLKGS